jgi:pilus assembly protein CpaB
MKPAQKNILILLVLAIVVAIGFRIAMAGSQTPQAAPAAHMLVGTGELAAGALLRSSDLGWKEIAPGDVPKNGILQNSAAAKTLTGALLRNAVRAGAPILSSDIISPTAPDFLAEALQPGMRAVSVPITDVSGNAGLIQPGDHVDLLLTQSLHDAKSAAHSVASETIATHLRVIAVGSSFQRPKDGDQLTANAQARTVTLEVTPRAAEAVTVAAHLGELSLALRSFANDDANSQSASISSSALNRLNSSAPASGPLWAGDISQAVRSAPAAAASDKVQILRGSADSASAQVPDSASLTNKPQ